MAIHAIESCELARDFSFTHDFIFLQFEIVVSNHS